jgi:anti-anti-sigma factor
MSEVVVVVTDPLDGAAVDHWSRVLAGAADQRPCRLVVDLAACPRMDAAAIVALLRVHKQMMRAGGALLLRTPPARVRRMLTLARVEQVLEVEEDPGQPGRELAGAR